MKYIHIINGANLNLLGKRETDIYGKQSFEAYFEKLYIKYKAENIELSYFQSNYEGAIIENIHACIDKPLTGMIINAGAFSHYSYAIADALRILTCPVIEVHISNLFARESFRHYSVMSAVVQGCITGLGLQGYDLAIKYLNQV